MYFFTSSYPALRTSSSATVEFSLYTCTVTTLSSQRETPSLVLTPVSGVFTSILSKRIFSRSARCTMGSTNTPRPQTTLGRDSPRPVTTMACVGGAFL